MELIAGLIIAFVLAFLAAEPEKLEDTADRRWINYLADQSRKNGPLSVRPRCKCTQTGYFFDKRQRRGMNRR